MQLRGGLLPLVMVSFLVGSLNQWFYLTVGFHQVGSPAVSRVAGSKLLGNGLGSKYVRPVVSWLPSLPLGVVTGDAGLVGLTMK